MKGLILGLLAWIGAVSEAPEMQYNGHALPQVRYGDHAFLVKIAKGKDADPKQYDLAGVYDYKRDTVWLLEGTDVNGQEGKAVLVHELVHYLQDMNGITEKAECIGETEPQAYEIEKVYRQNHGLQVPWSEMTVLLWSQCGTPR